MTDKTDYDNIWYTDERIVSTASSLIVNIACLVSSLTVSLWVESARVGIQRDILPFQTLVSTLGQGNGIFLW